MKSPWILRFLTLAGLGICSYLGGLKLAGKTTSLAGCGAGSGCSNVLGSEWSQFFGIPVSVLAGAVYLAQGQGMIIRTSSGDLTRGKKRRQ